MDLVSRVATICCHYCIWLYMVIWLYVVIYPTVFHLFLLVLHRFLFTSVTVVACVTVDMCHSRHVSNLFFFIPRFVGIACPWGQLDDSMCDRCGALIK